MNTMGSNPVQQKSPETPIPGNSANVPCLGWLSDPFKDDVGDLQLRDNKVTLNHLVQVNYHISAHEVRNWTGCDIVTS